MERKACPRCHEDKDPSEFYRSAAAVDGLSSYCKLCAKAYRLEWEGQNLTPERKREYQQRFREAHPGYGTQAKKEWMAKNPEKARELERRKSKRRHEKRMKAKHGPDYVVGAAENRLGHSKAMLSNEEKRLRRSARIKVHKAVYYKRLQKLPCWECGSEESQAHHPDYSKPLSVVWLCQAHHLEVHAMTE